MTVTESGSILPSGSLSLPSTLMEVGAPVVVVTLSFWALGGPLAGTGVSVGGGGGVSVGGGGGVLVGGGGGVLVGGGGRVLVGTGVLLAVMVVAVGTGVLPAEGLLVGVLDVLPDPVGVGLDGEAPVPEPVEPPESPESPELP